MRSGFVRPSRYAVLVAAAAILLGLAPATHAELGIGGLRPRAGARDGAIVRGVYGRDTSASGVRMIADTGFNSVTVDPSRTSLDDLAERGLSGVVWLGGYDNESCSWERGRAWVVDHVDEVSGHRAIAAYQLGDEPNAHRCPDAPEQVRRRHELVKSLDSSAETYVVVSAWDGRERFPYENFAGSTDVMGVDIYPCNFRDAECTFEDIAAAITELHADGVTRFWAVVQDFTDGKWYRSPTPEELRTQFDRWAGSGLEGYFVYHWEHGDLESKPKHLELLKEQNQRNFSAG